MKLFRKIVLSLVICILSVSFCLPIYASSNDYAVYDISLESSSFVETFYSFDEALTFYQVNLSKYENLCLLQGDSVLRMEFGTITFKSDDNNASYYSVEDEVDKNIENVKDYDALYLSIENNQVRFVCNGDIGLIDMDLVNFIPFGYGNVSYYEVNNDKLVHHIASAEKNYYKYNLAIDEPLSYLVKDTIYYSYDSHYFYDDFYNMVKDFKANVKENAINRDNPYFNYYAYLSQRSYTNYSYDELNNFFEHELSFNNRLNGYRDMDKDGANDIINRSEYYGNIKSFTTYEKIYGVNALLSLAWSIEESSFGKSYNSFFKSNVFNHEALTNEEAKFNKYFSVNSSIYSHYRNFVSRKYSDPYSTYYNGTNIGDYMSGLSSMYSNDPYFGERVVSFAYFIDKALGLKDLHSYSIGITKNNPIFYYDEYCSRSFVNAKGKEYIGLIVLDKNDKSYKVQSDYSRNQNGEYNPEENILYIDNDRMFCVEEGNNTNKTYKKIMVDYRDIDDNGDVVTLFYTDNFDFDKEYTYREFNDVDIVGYNLENDVYKPIIKRIKTLSPLDGFEYPFINDNGYVLNDATITIEYDDGTKKDIKLTGDDIYSASNNDKCTEVFFVHNGVTNSYSINGQYNVITEETTNNLNDFVVYHNGYKTDYSFGVIGRYDMTFINTDKQFSTFFKSTRFDLSVEGIYPTLIYNCTDVLSDVINTFYFETKKIKENNNLSLIASNYNLDYVSSFKIKASRSFYDIDLINPIVMQVNIDNKEQNKVYTVYHVSSNGDIYKLPSQFTDNYIKFISDEFGDFYLFSVDTASTYYNNDKMLRFDSSQNGIDMYETVSSGLYLITFGVMGLLLYIIYLFIEREDKKIWIGCRNLLQKVESVPEEKPNN